MTEPDPVFVRIPRGELERRWALVREHMHRHQLEAIVALGHDDSLSGYLRWFCDFGSVAYTKVVIFFRDNPMTIVEHGPLEGARAASPDDINTPGVDRVLSTAAFVSVAPTHDYEARAVVKELQRHGVRRVGLLGVGGMPHGFVNYLCQQLAACEISDETDAVDRMKAVKSAVELQYIRAACAAQDLAFSKLLTIISPGMRDVELLSIVESELRRLGAQDGTLLGGSAASGKAAFLRPWRSQNRILGQGDCFTILIELSNSAGYYGELARQIVVGKPSTEHVEAYQFVQEAQAAAVSRLKPGTLCAELALAHDGFMRGHGHPAESRLFSHGQGYDMVERPLIRKDETMQLEPQMFLSCHPSVVSPSVFAFQCDNYLVHADGPPERIHRTAQQIFAI